jgi:hypothetical protein
MQTTSGPQTALTRRSSMGGAAAFLAATGSAGAVLAACGGGEAVAASSASSSGTPTLSPPRSSHFPSGSRARASTKACPRPRAGRGGGRAVPWHESVVGGNRVIT